MGMHDWATALAGQHARLDFPTKMMAAGLLALGACMLSGMTASLAEYMCNKFTGYYDYDDELPAGCEHSNEQATTSTGALNLVASFPAPAGSPALAPDQAVVAAEAAPAASAAAAPGHDASAGVSLQVET